MAQFRFEIFEKDTLVKSDMLEEVDVESALRSVAVALAVFSTSHPELRQILTIVLLDDQGHILDRLTAPVARTNLRHQPQRTERCPARKGSPYGSPSRTS